MMQDYDRTMELVDAAYSSSGASQTQFEKTQDSLESKINKLKNAWNEFLMGITNSTVIKTGIDLLTGLLNIINSITGAFGQGVGGVMKFGLAIGALTGGSKLTSKALAGLGDYMGTMKDMSSVRRTGKTVAGEAATASQIAAAKAGDRKAFGASQKTAVNNEIATENYKKNKDATRNNARLQRKTQIATTHRKAKKDISSIDGQIKNLEA
jgi:hypothetical protein